MYGMSGSGAYRSFSSCPFSALHSVIPVLMQSSTTTPLRIPESLTRLSEGLDDRVQDGRRRVIARGPISPEASDAMPTHDPEPGLGQKGQLEEEDVPGLAELQGKVEAGLGVRTAGREEELQGVGKRVRVGMGKGRGGLGPRGPEREAALTMVRSHQGADSFIEFVIF